jgi:hypothetical protein
VIAKTRYVVISNYSPYGNFADVMQSVIILSVSDDSDAAPIKKKATTKQKNTQKSAATNLEAKAMSNSKSKPRLANLQVLKIERAASVALHASPAISSSTDSHDVNNLPEFARSAWSTLFLPTLYDCLGRASDPFVLGADMVKVIQEIVDIVYPFAEYRVLVDDRIFTMVCVLSFLLCFHTTDTYIGEGSSQQKKELLWPNSHQNCYQVF